SEIIVVLIVLCQNSDSVCILVIKCQGVQIGFLIISYRQTSSFISIFVIKNKPRWFVSPLKSLPSDNRIRNILGICYDDSVVSCIVVFYRYLLGFHKAT